MKISIALIKPNPTNIKINSNHILSLKINIKLKINLSNFKIIN